MGTIKRKYHSTYKGYDIYFREGIKRRPWSVLIYPNKEAGKFSDRRTIDSCYQLIERKRRSENE